MKNMATSIMSPLLFTCLLAFLAVAAQARTLSERSQSISQLKTMCNYEIKRLSLPPPKLSPLLHQLTTYKRPVPSSPPPPSSSSSPDQLTKTGSPCVAGSPCRSGVITMVTDYGKTPRPGAPPTPKPSPSEQEAIVEQLLHKVTTMVTDYGRTPRPGTPPTPKPSPEEHEAIVEQLLRRKSSQNYYAA